MYESVYVYVMCQQICAVEQGENIEEKKKKSIITIIIIIIIISDHFFIYWNCRSIF